VIEPAALLAWSALALIVTLTPGPDTLLVASHGARGGFRSGMAALAGIMTGVVWYGSLIAFGALSILVAVPALFLAVKIAGALYLAWLGAGMIWNAVRPSSPSMGEVSRAQLATGGVRARSMKKGPYEAPSEPPAGLTPSVALRATAPPSRGSTGSAYRQGFFTNALNPKVALFYLAALPQFAGTGADAPVIGVMLLAIHAVFGFVWLSFVAFAASRARSIVWNSAAVRWLEGAVGVFFVGVAGRLALAQAR
jgi:threonine/homoserine/homoserine lactone efflux protein